MKIDFFRCPVCGNVVVKVVDSGVVPSCCGRPMERLEPHTAEQGVEKHLPVVTDDGSGTYRVDVGSEPHPMVEEHHVQFIAVSSGNGVQLRFLHGGDKPRACFSFCDTDAPFSTTEGAEVFEYCNIHGLWRHTMRKA